MKKQERIDKMVQEIRGELDRIESMEEPLFDDYVIGSYSKEVYCVDRMYGDDVTVAVYMEIYETLPNIVDLRCSVSRRGRSSYTTSCIRGSVDNIEKGVTVLDKVILANIKQVSDIEF